MTQERAVLAGGCFWGMQDLIRRHDGVISTRVGYTGGDVPNATYRRLRHSRARRTTSTAASSSAYRAGHGTGTLFPSGFRLVRNFSELQAPPGPFHRQQCIPFGARPAHPGRPGSCQPAAAQIAVHCTRDKVIWKSQGPDRARPIPR